MSSIFLSLLYSHASNPLLHHLTNRSNPQEKSNIILLPLLSTLYMPSTYIPFLTVSPFLTTSSLLKSSPSPLSYPQENNRIVKPVENLQKMDKVSKVKLFNVKPTTPPKMKPSPEVLLGMNHLDDHLSVADIKGETPVYFEMT